MKKKIDILNTLDVLIKDPTISKVERQLLSDAKLALAKGIYDEKVAATLKSQLSKLALAKNLTPVLVPFFTELSRQYLGTGKRGMLYTI
ncbi:bacteriocin immunity protein [Lactobacillus sp. CBA3605]|uniref:bacteriocin immunity protein n=1 Tax=Lactobacillus sp. CBA3605 TaxID=2099788 RepID=UPI000CFC0203|nr:bacteriocin immunity protein [Lactobacillus sp. CBA3605]AVK61837.1 bacteriocin immunity protein [Lactobacillus sp. CBA3605]